ncbi:MAG: hypothetical protein RR439_01625 [Carnobacterium sp.]
MKYKNSHLLLLIFIPIVLGASAQFIWGIHSSLISGILYVILFMFNLPSGNFMGADMDYQTKRINPSYKVEKREISSLNKQTLITLLILVALTITSFFIYFQQIQY